MGDAEQERGSRSLFPSHRSSSMRVGENTSAKPQLAGLVPINTTRVCDGSSEAGSLCVRGGVRELQWEEGGKGGNVRGCGVGLWEREVRGTLLRKRQ